MISNTNIFFVVENSLQLLRTAHQKNLEDADMEIENFKTELGTIILMKTMGEIKQMKSLSDPFEKTVHELNMTVKETLQKPDEGTYSLINSFFILTIHFFNSNISLLFSSLTLFLCLPSFYLFSYIVNLIRISYSGCWIQNLRIRM